MSSQFVTYRVDDATTVKLEIEPMEGFQLAGSGEVLGRVQDDDGPTVQHGDGNRMHCAAVAGERSVDEDAGGQVPYPHGPVVAAGDDDGPAI